MWLCRIDLIERNSARHSDFELRRVANITKHMDIQTPHGPWVQTQIYGEAEFCYQNLSTNASFRGIVTRGQLHLGAAGGKIDSARKWRTSHWNSVWRDGSALACRSSPTSTQHGIHGFRMTVWNVKATLFLEHYAEVLVIGIHFPEMCFLWILMVLSLLHQAPRYDNVVTGWQWCHRI